MSKRVGNSKKGRRGRVKIGWKKQRMLRQLDQLDTLLSKEDLKEDKREKYETMKAKLTNVLTPTFIRRHQSR